MKRSLTCWLFVLALAAIPRAAFSQEVSVPANIVVTDSVAARPTTAATQTVISAPAAARVTVGVAPSTHFSSEQQAAAEQGGIKGTLFGSQRRTSNTLMIGGVVVAGVGVGVVKGEIGALLGVLGLLSSIGGLYLAF